MRVQRIVLLIMVGFCSSATLGQGTVLVEGAFAFTEGAFLGPLDYPPKSVKLTDDSPELGVGAQLGCSYLFGREHERLRIQTGIRVGVRNYKQSVRTESSGIQPSSFKSYDYTYDGVITSKNWKVGIPAILWFRIGGQSHVLFGVEFQTTFNVGCSESGELITKTTHYHQTPDYVPESIEYSSSRYFRTIAVALAPVRLGWNMGYRFRSGKAFMFGPDLSYIQDGGQWAVREAALTCVWTFPQDQEDGLK